MNKEFHFSHPLKVQNVNFLRKNVDVRGFTFDNLEYAAMSSLPLNNVTQVFGCEIKEYERKWASKKVTSQRWHFIDIVHMFKKVKKIQFSALFLSFLTLTMKSRPLGRLTTRPPVCFPFCTLASSNKELAIKYEEK